VSEYSPSMVVVPNIGTKKSPLLQRQKVKAKSGKKSKSMSRMMARKGC